MVRTAEKIRIDKGIPVPKRYPFEDMEVGDSFLVPLNKTRTATSVAAKRYGDMHGKKFTVRLDAERRLRCWRVQ